MRCWTRAPSSAGTADPLALPVAESYARELADARAATGRDESVLTGEGRVFGRRVAVVVCEFDFLGGSIGVAAAERITAAVQRATAERLPLLASPSSGGTRMQEGTVAFLQMVKIAAAVAPAQTGAPALPGLPAQPDHRRGLRVVGLAGPCHLRRAGRPDRLSRAPGVRAALRRTLPVRRPDRGEPAAARGDRRRRRARTSCDATLDRALTVIADAPEPPPAPQPPEPIPDVPAWDSVLASRRPDRPGVGHAAAARRHRPGAAVRYRAGRGRDDAAGAGPVHRPARGGAGPAAGRPAGWSGPRRCARPVAAWRWPPSCACRWCW